MIIEGNDCDAPYMSTIMCDGKIVGEVTSGAYGHRVGASIALGMVKTDLAKPGQISLVSYMNLLFKNRDLFGTPKTWL